MANVTTKINDMINPEVMQDMVSGKLPNKIVVSKIAKVDDTLQGQPGSTITIPTYSYIGDAADLTEGATIDADKLGTSSKQVTIKKAGKAVDLTDEAVLSGYGNPIGEANIQLAKSIGSKIDADCLATLQTATYKYNDTGIISYAGIVNAIDLFNEESNTEKVTFINPKQVTQLRLDENFISREKYGNQVMINGEIGMIANTRIVPSNKVALKSGKYYCPIVKLNGDDETEDEASAITIYVKKNVEIETERTAGVKTKVVATEHYAVGLTNDSKVVVASFLATAPASTGSTDAG